MKYFVTIYLVSVALNNLFYVLHCRSQGFCTVKDLVLYFIATYLPILNTVVTTMAIWATVDRAYESVPDKIIWTRKPRRRRHDGSYM